MILERNVIDEPKKLPSCDVDMWLAWLFAVICFLKSQNAKDVVMHYNLKPVEI